MFQIQDLLSFWFYCDGNLFESLTQKDQSQS